jgi:peptidoglycan/LPS O-acetylase OafA/YrhL
MSITAAPRHDPPTVPIRLTAPPARLPAPVSRRTGADHFRGDIEGLRAVAVVLVVLDHLLGWPKGGFIGVDVFFVISGFLITGLLLREHEKTGRISFADFYRRRVRRILPASVLVLAVTAVASSLLFFGSRTQSTLVDAVWALLFSANWRMVSAGTDYMNAEGPVSPLQHYWSLAVEEQFYFIWPVVLVLALGYAARRGSMNGRGVAGISIGALSLVSVAWALWETQTEPTAAYFSTLSRAWELGVGALLAIAAGRLSRMSGTARTAMAWCGLTAVAVSVFVIDPSSRFPAPWALLPVLGTALVIASGTGGRAAGLWPLTNPVSRYVGSVSYSLYLWHFPVIVLCGVVVQPGETEFYIWSVAGMTALSVLGFHLVEQPVRRSHWLKPGAPERSPSAPHGRRERLVLVSVVAVLAVTAVYLSQAAGVRMPFTTEPENSAAPVSGTAGAPTAAPAAVLAAEVSDALSATDWPDLDPGLDALGEAALAPEWAQDGCLNVSDQNVRDCRYGDAAASRTAVLLGDSLSISWLPGIRGALEGSGWSVQNLTLGQCPAVAVSVIRSNSPAGFTEQCNAHHEWVRDQIETIRPNLVIISSSSYSLQRLASGATGQARIDEWTAAMTTTLTQLDGLADRVVVLAPPPSGANLLECATRLNSPQDCDSSPTEWYRTMVAAESDAAGRFSGQTPVQYANTLDWFCAEDRCPSFIGGTPVFADGSHLTQAFSTRLSGVLRPVLLGGQ